jgi:hypothetical protein
MTCPRTVRPSTIALLGLALAAAACGGESSNSADAGACPVAPLSFAWPSQEDPQVCARDPSTTPTAVRTQCGDITEDCAGDGTTVPALSCIGQVGGGTATPQTVTLTGYADVFSSGPSSDGVRLQIFRADAIGDGVTDLAQVSPIAIKDIVLDETTLATARACPASRTEPEDLHGNCIQPSTDCEARCPRELSAADFCHNTSCVARQRWEIRYEIPDVPTNTFLVVRSIGLTSSGTPDTAHETWAPMVQYNVYLSTDERACGDDEDRNCLNAGEARYQMNVNLLSRSDYRTIPLTAGLSSGIAEGHGGVAGEVHDCDNIRIEHAQIGFSPLPLKNTYFNGNPVQTLPDLSRGSMGTDALGLYAGLDLVPGPVHLVALGNVGGVVTLLGEFTARIWPNTITIVGLNGGKPVQP